MSKKRYVDTKFWDDTYIIDLDPIEKLLFLYFLTNPLTELSGAYEISLRRIAFDTGIDGDMIAKILARFDDAGKMTYRDGWILIANFQSYQALNPKIQQGIDRALKDAPTWIQDRLSIGYQSLSYLDLDSNLDSNSHSDPNSGANTTRTVDFGYPVALLFDAFPDLSLTPAQCGLIEAAVTTPDAEAWRLTIQKYQENHNAELGRYDPSKVGNVLGVFRDFKAKALKDGTAKKPTRRLNSLDEVEHQREQAMQITRPVPQ